MKALLINGSPRGRGCTFTALTELADALEKEGVSSEIVHIPSDVPGCKACRRCFTEGRCAIDDIVNEIGSRLDEFDAIVLGSPVYYAGPSGQICAFADRLFYSNSKKLGGKLGACVVSCRRGGATAAFDRLNKYFTICGMPIFSSQYWNQVHGNTPDEVRQDVEGMQTMRTLGRNMAWLLRCIEAGRKEGIAFPEREPWTPTNFIRIE